MIRNVTPVMEVAERRRTRTPQLRGMQRMGGQVEEEPTLMKVAAIDNFGPPSELTLHTVPVPELGTRDVLIELHSAGVGIWDAEIRGGWWPKGRPRFPLTLGSDGAGIIVAKGPRVRRFAVGDRVWASEFINSKGGFYAEYVAVHADRLGRVPDDLDLMSAGAGAVTGLTALQGIDEKLRLRKGDTVLIFGASGAVGTLAVQFAKLRHARVLGTASGREATALVRSLGADGVLDSRSRDFMDQLRDLAPDGLDAILALAGDNALEHAMDLMRAGGRLAFPRGVEPEPGPRRMIRLIPYDAVSDPRHFSRLERAAEDAHLKVPIAASYPLSQAAKAHERLEKGHVLGRLALRIRRGSE